MFHCARHHSHNLVLRKVQGTRCVTDIDPKTGERVKPSEEQIETLAQEAFVALPRSGTIGIETSLEDSEMIKRIIDVEAEIRSEIEGEKTRITIWQEENANARNHQLLFGSYSYIHFPLPLVT